MLTVACVKWGDRYGPEYVRILADMVRRNLSAEARFVCLTDRPDEVGCETQPIPEGLTGWWPKVALFEPGRFEGRVLFLDLDVVVAGGLDELVEHGGIIRDWHLPCYNSSVMCWTAGEYDHIWTRFTPDVVTRLRDDQRWITEASDWKVFPPGWCVSYRSHAVEAIPNGTKVVCFHGTPKPHEVKSGWVPEMWKVGGLREARFTQNMNVSFGQAVEQVRVNARRNLPWLLQSEPHAKQQVIVGGGPSLCVQLPHIRRRVEKGASLWAVNGSLAWLQSKGLMPDFYVMMDARPENVAFVKDAPIGPTYLISSQCHPDVFDALEGRKVVMWHGDIKQPEINDILEASGRPWALIGGGNTVGLRAMYVGFVGGFRSIHLYGFDSCYSGNTHHAYAQPLNDGEQLMTVRMGSGGKEYVCAPWMAKQAQDFEKCATALIQKGAWVTAHGTGLIPDMSRKINAHYRKERVAA